MFCTRVALNTLTISNKFWTSIRINKWDTFRLQRYYKLGLWPTTSLEPRISSCSWYRLYVYLLLTSTPLYASTMLPKNVRNHKITSFEGKGVRVIDTINGDNFNIWKCKLEMGLVYVDLWGIIDECEGVLSSNTNSKVKKENTKGVSKKQCLSSW